MGKLENIPKKQVFSVPQNYFDKLPSQIQSRLSREKEVARLRPGYRLALQYALPLLAVSVTLFFFFTNPSTADAESILASVETADLVNYLHESELSTEDLLENINFNRQEVEAIENVVYDLGLTDSDLDEINNETELNTR